MGSPTIQASYYVWPVEDQKIWKRRRVGIFIYPIPSLPQNHLGVAYSLYLKSQCLSEDFSIQSSVSPYSGDFSILLTLQVWGVITESYGTLSFMTYLYFAHSFVNSPFRKHSSKYPVWVFHLFHAKTQIVSNCLPLFLFPALFFSIALTLSNLLTYYLFYLFVLFIVWLRNQDVQAGIFTCFVHLEHDRDS